VEALYLHAGLENGVEYGGLDYGIYIFHSNTQLYCVAICLLTYSEPAPWSLLQVVGVKVQVHI